MVHSNSVMSLLVMVALLHCGMALKHQGRKGYYLVDPEIADFLDSGETYDCRRSRSPFVPDTTPDEELPFVTVVVPTSQRRHKYHKLVNHTFFSQIYPAEKLDMLVFDGPDAQQSPHKRSDFTPLQSETSPLAYFWMKSERVEYEYDTEGLSLGAKRNWLVKEATGDLIISFDDDDFYNAYYVRFMVEHMMKHPTAQLVKLAGWYSMKPRVGATALASNTDRFAVGCYEQPGNGFGFSLVFRSSVTEICHFEDRNGREENDFLACLQKNFIGKVHQIGDTHSQVLKMDTCVGIADMVQLAKMEIPMSEVVKMYGLEAWSALQHYSLPHIDRTKCAQKWKQNSTRNLLG